MPGRGRGPLPAFPSKAREDGLLVDETETVPEGIGGVERTLSPRAGHDVARVLVVLPARGEASELSRARVDFFEIPDREVDVVRSGLGPLTPPRRVQDREDDGSAVEIVTGAMNSSPARA